MPPRNPDRPGERETIAGRYALLEEIAAGGQGTVYRARDGRLGQDVAIKLATDVQPGELNRFAGEAAILGELSHPGIVRYLDHGQAAGSAYLVMEWLDGETLATRLRRGPVPLAQVLAMGARLLEALGVLHGRGLVHRDVKPSNILLRDDDATRPVLLDLGIARHLRDAQPGAAGTPAYAAPEQAQGSAALDERADLFAVGCVLFHALAGRPPYVGANVLAVLAKIALLPSPSLAAVAPAMPPAIVDVVARLLAKDPRGRPRNAAAALALLAAAERGEPLPPDAPLALGSAEHEILSVVMTSRPGQHESAAATRVIEAPGSEAGTNIEASELGDTAVVAVRSGPSAAAQALRAARYALEVRDSSPSSAVAVATGPGIVALSLPVGGVLDTAASLLEAEAARSLATGEPPRIMVDRATAGLVGHELELRRDDGGYVLVGPRATTTRQVDGPFVGRDQELSTLLGAFEACRTGTRRAVRWLIHGPAGSGKSRLASELVAAARAQDPRVVVWSGRGDPLRTGSPFATIASLQRTATGSGPVRTVRAIEGAGLEQLVTLGHATEVSINEGHAGGNETLLDGMTRTFEDWLARLCDEGPVILVFDDLQWADLPSLRLLAEAMAALSHRRMMLVALGRPEVQARFAAEIADLHAQPLALGELAPLARRTLAARLLGLPVDAPAVLRLVEHAGGLPLFLEEMALVAGAGPEPEAGETMAAMVATRLRALPPPARSLLRAGSIFGQRFWLDGAALLLGGEAIPAATIEALVRDDLVRESPGSRFRGRRELAFRHAVLRDAAYALLTDEDRRNGHRLAAGWLERAGETDAETLAAHHEGAGELALAGAAYELAAGRALRAADFNSAARLAEAGLRCATEGERRIRLLLVAMEALNWLGENERALELGREADSLTAPGSAASAHVLSELSVACGLLGDRELVLALQERVAGCLARSADLADPGACAHTRAGATVVFQVVGLGLRRLLDARLFDQLERVSPGRPAADERVWGDVYAARGSIALYEGAQEQAASLIRQAGDAYQRIGAIAMARTQWANAGYALMELGALDEAIVFLRRSLYEWDGRTLWAHHTAVSASNLGYALICTGRMEEGIELLEQALSRLTTRGNKRYAATAEMYLAEAHRRRGDLPRARALAEAAVAGLADFSALLAPAEAVRASILLALGEPEEALRSSLAAVAILEEIGGVEERESLVRLVHARALAAVGRTDEAHAALGAALDRLLARAVELSPERRRGFLERIEENRATIELARAWGLVSGPPS